MTMMICPGCAKQVLESAEKCTFCGTNLPRAQKSPEAAKAGTVATSGNFTRGQTIGSLAAVVVVAGVIFATQTDMLRCSPTPNATPLPSAPPVAQTAPKVPAVTPLPQPGQPPVGGTVSANEANGVPNLSPFLATMPPGWRDLRFGMKEAEVSRIVNRYRTQHRPHGDPWEKTPSNPEFPLLMPTGMIVDISMWNEKRFHHWETSQLDEGASDVQAWFDKGILFAVKVHGGGSVSDFVEKATTTYGAPPRTFQAVFIEKLLGSASPPEKRDVFFWRGQGITAIFWQSGSEPTALILTDQAITTLSNMVAEEHEHAEAFGKKLDQEKKAAVRF
jgi:hypothetical protein